MNGGIAASSRLFLCPVVNISSARELSRKISVGFTAECTRTFSEDDIRQFSLLSRDDNPLHLSTDYARKTRFGRPIVHGTLILGLVYKHIGGEGSILVSIASKFTAPAYPKELLVARATVSDVRRRIVTVALQCQAVERREIVVEGSATIMVPKADK